MLFLALTYFGPAHASPTLKRERVVLLMRHGVRPPTHEPALDPAIAPDPWPTWEVPDGFLTPHGAAAIKLLAAYDRTIFAPGAGCPAISLYADVDERTIKTADAFAAGFAPGCKMLIGHAAGAKDMLFSPLDDGAPNFDAKLAKATMLAAAGGSLSAFVQAHAKLYQQLQNTLAPGSSAYLSLPATIAAKTSNRLPKLTGPIAEGASAGEDFLLEYLDGKPMAQVGWGRLAPADVSTLLTLHPLEYTITARPDYIAETLAAPLARRIAADLAATDHAQADILVGHDTNLAALGGMLNLHWHLGGYPEDDPPPGGGLLFSLMQDGAGTQYVTVAYQVQTMDQVRDLEPLNAAHPPVIEDLPIPGCGNSIAPTSCTLTNFLALIAAKTNTHH